MTFTPAPKPPRREKKPRKPLPKPTQRIAKVNPTYKAKRVAKQRKHYASKEYKAARKLALERSGGQCEAILVLDSHSDMLLDVRLPGESTPSIAWLYATRCRVTDGLDFHETEYGSEVGIIREIKGFMLCPHNHAWIERTRHPTRSHGR